MGTVLPTLEECLELYAGLVKSMAWQYRNRGLSLEDLSQEGMIGLIKAYDKYDESKGTEFSTYAVYWIKKQILSALASESQSTVNVIDMDQYPDKTNNNNEHSSIKLHFPDNLPELERMILTLSLEDKQPLSNIAAQLGISTERCKQIKQKALRRLRTMI